MKSGRRSRLTPKTGAASAAIGAFTLIELLMVVVILGIIAALVIPQFTGTTDDAKLSSMTTDLASVRKQLQLYRQEHNGAFPPAASFVAVMTGKSNPDGTTTGSPLLGPYLNSIPVNPFTDDASIGNGAVGSSSWYYEASSGEFRANCHNAHTVY